MDRVVLTVDWDESVMGAAVEMPSYPEHHSGPEFLHSRNSSVPLRLRVPEKNFRNVR